MHNLRRVLLLGGVAALTLPRVAGSGVSDRLYRIGFLSAGGDGVPFLAKPLAERGYVVGKNLRFEVRVAKGFGKHVETAAAELARTDVDVLAAFWTHRVKALAKATRTTPIVCCMAPDPVGSGLARSIRRPGGNITGLSGGAPEASEILVGLLRAVRPALKRVIGLYQVSAPAPEAFKSLSTVAGAKGIGWDWIAVKDVAEVERAFAALKEPKASAAYVGTAIEGATVPNESRSRAPISDIAIRHRVVLASNARSGALLQYGLDHADLAGSIASIIDKILRGGNPAEIPFELPDRTTFVLNRETARAIGVQLSPDILLRATEVIG